MPPPSPPLTAIVDMDKRTVAIYYMSVCNLIEALKYERGSHLAKGTP